MKKLICVLLVALLMPISFAEAETPADTILRLFAANDFEGAFELSGAEMRAALGSAEAYGGVWAQFGALYGGYIGGAVVETAAQSGYDIYFVDCEFELAVVRLQLTFDADALLAGLFVVSYEMKGEPADADSGIIVEEIALRPGEPDETRGALTLPEGDGPFPCVIMMAGSGPSDMDMTLSGVKVFKEISRELAKRGVASVRYDKYTYAHGDKIDVATFGIDGEYLSDARAAFEIISTDARISEIFLLGHSLGACVAPRLAYSLGVENIDGCVMLAGTPISLFELLLRQLSDMDYPAEEIETMKNTYCAPDGDDEIIYYAPVRYYKDEANVDEAAIIIGNNMPVFIAQGADDTQVLPSEGVEAWRAALSDYAGAEYHIYEGMAHSLLVDGDLSNEMLDDVAAWILAN